MGSCCGSEEEKKQPVDIPLVSTTSTLSMSMILQASKFWKWFTGRKEEARHLTQLLNLHFVRKPFKMKQVFQCMDRLFDAWTKDYDNKLCDISEYCMKLAGNHGKFNCRKMEFVNIVSALSGTLDEKYPAKYTVPVRIAFEQTLYLFVECMWTYQKDQIENIHKLENYVSIDEIFRHKLERDVFLSYIKNYHGDGQFFQLFHLANTYLQSSSVQDKRTYIFRMGHWSTETNNIIEYLNKHSACIDYTELDEMVYQLIQDMKSNIKEEWWHKFQMEVIKAFR